MKQVKQLKDKHRDRAWLDRQDTLWYYDDHPAVDQWLNVDIHFSGNIFIYHQIEPTAQYGPYRRLKSFVNAG